MIGVVGVSSLFKKYAMFQDDGYSLDPGSWKNQLNLCHASTQRSSQPLVDDRGNCSQSAARVSQNSEVAP